jgi:hypothetical protein
VAELTGNEQNEERAGHRDFSAMQHFVVVFDNLRVLSKIFDAKL